jgi:transposase, IS30 family
MGAKYNHITYEERIIIKTLLQEGIEKKEIAEKLERDESTIKREIKRNTGKRGYRPNQAQEMAEERRKQPRNIKMTPEIIEHIEEKINTEFSPEQISGSMENEIGVKVSYETIYKYLIKDKTAGGLLYKKLRTANGKRNRKRYGKRDRRGSIPERIGIENRPEIVDQKKRFGDWEADLVSGSYHRGYLVTLVERKSKYTIIGHVKNKTKESVSVEIIRILQGKKVHTITYDNGREFCGHTDVNLTLGCKSYFAAPYHSWERGLNENTNGLIRQYFPKGMDLRDVSYDELEFVESRLNNRPRKTLDFKTPNEVLFKYLS